MNKITNEELCCLTKSGEPTAVENLIENNIGFVTSIANEMYSQYEDIIEFDDLFQAGQIAIWKCADKFDANTGVTFLTYAKRAIQNEMMDLIRKNLSVAVTEDTGFDENLETDELIFSSEAAQEHYLKTPENIFLKSEQIQELYSALKRLEPRYRTYLLYRFGEKGHSVADTAFHFSISESRARTVEKAALDRLRELMFAQP